MIKVSIIGANGYTGLELMTLLAQHKNVEIKHLVSRSNDGVKVIDVYPNLFAYKDFCFESASESVIVADSDIVFVALPHGASAEFGAALFKKGVRVIDLSADFRYKKVAVYEEWYKTKHQYPQLSELAVYGMPEIYRQQIKNASLVANPGCYTTCSILPLYPLLKEKLVSSENIIIDAKSGTSGAGKKAEPSNLFCEVNENFKAYGVTTHRHTSEIEQELSLVADKEITLSFTPHLLPVQRGILCTSYLNIESGVTSKQIFNAFQKHYKNEPFVVINEEGRLPELKHVKGTNYISIGYKIDARLNRLVVVSVIDNLVKGASGQAIQNMNIMFQIPETEGLTALSKYI